MNAQWWDRHSIIAINIPGFCCCSLFVFVLRGDMEGRKESLVHVCSALKSSQRFLIRFQNLGDPPWLSDSPLRLFILPTESSTIPFIWVNVFSAEWLHYPAFFQQNFGILTTSFLTFHVLAQACSVSAETTFFKDLVWIFTGFHSIEQKPHPQVF